MTQPREGKPLEIPIPGSFGPDDLIIAVFGDQTFYKRVSDRQWKSLPKPSWWQRILHWRPW